MMQYLLNFYLIVKKYVSSSVNKRVFYFSDLIIKFKLNKNKYFLDLFGYNDNLFKRILKIIFLYFFFKLLFDLIYIIYLIVFEIYLIFIEVIFNLLFDFKYVLQILFKNNSRLIFIENRYYRIIRWFYLFFSFNKFNLYKLKRIFFVEKPLLKIIDFFYNFISNTIWFFLYRKQTRKKYFLFRKLIVWISFFLFFLVFFSFSLIFQLIVINILFIYYYFFYKEYIYIDIPDEISEKKKKILSFLFISLLKNIFKKLFNLCLDLLIFIVFWLMQFRKNCLKLLFKKNG